MALPRIKLPGSEVHCPGRPAGPGCWLLLASRSRSAVPLNPAFFTSRKSNYFPLLMFAPALEIIIDLMIIRSLDNSCSPA